MGAGHRLTRDEQAVLDTLAEAWNQFSQLEVEGEDIWDQTEFTHAIHAAQYVVLSRPALRQMKDREDEDSGLWS